jgi:membrane protein
MKVYGMNINKKVSVMILFIFILCSSVALADASSDAFAQVFREASGSGNNVIERVVDALYYGLLIMYRGVSVKVSQLCGLFLVFFMTLDILTAILKNIAQVDLYSVFRTIIPKFVKNLIIAFILVTPTYYSLKIGVGGGATALKMKGTLVTQITEMFFDMFYRLGTLFFNDPGMARATPGRIAMAFFNRPLEMLKDIFGFMVFFAIFTNLAKVILLLFCLWLSGKIIAVYISNIFTALILTTFSIFYLMFLTMESTAQIGQKGIQMIVQQSVTLFMTVAMMGISYQVMNLVAAGNSIQAIAALAVVLLMLSQVMENIGMMAIAVTTGSGLGISSDSAFMGLAQAAGMAVSGLAMFGGAKLDELTNRKDGGKNNNSSYKGGDNKNNDTFRKALQNVGRPETDGNNAYGRTRAGVAFKKNAANARNMNDADSSMRNSAKKRHGMGVMSAKLFSAMVGGMTTSNLYDFDVLKGVGSEFKDVFSDKDFEGMGSNYPYSSKYYEDMRDNAKLMLGEAWDTAVGKLSKVNLGDSSGSEAVRQARLNAGNMIKAPKKVKVSNYDRK